MMDTFIGVLLLVVLCLLQCGAVPVKSLHGERVRRQAEMTAISQLDNTPFWDNNEDTIQQSAHHHLHNSNNPDNGEQSRSPGSQGRHFVNEADIPETGELSPSVRSQGQGHSSHYDIQSENAGNEPRIHEFDMSEEQNRTDMDNFGEYNSRDLDIDLENLDEDEGQLPTEQRGSEVSVGSGHHRDENNDNGENSVELISNGTSAESSSGEETEHFNSRREIIEETMSGENNETHHFLLDGMGEKPLSPEHELPASTTRRPFLLDGRIENPLLQTERSENILTTSPLRLVVVNETNNRATTGPGILTTRDITVQHIGAVHHVDSDGEITEPPNTGSETSVHGSDNGESSSVTIASQHPVREGTAAPEISGQHNHTTQIFRPAISNGHVAVLPGGGHPHLEHNEQTQSGSEIPQTDSGVPIDKDDNEHGHQEGGEPVAPRHSGQPIIIPITSLTTESLIEQPETTRGSTITLTTSIRSTNDTHGNHGDEEGHHNQEHTDHEHEGEGHTNENGENPNTENEEHEHDHSEIPHIHETTEGQELVGEPKPDKEGEEKEGMHKTGLDASTLELSTPMNTQLAIDSIFMLLSTDYFWEISDSYFPFSDNSFYPTSFLPPNLKATGSLPLETNKISLKTTETASVIFTEEYTYSSSSSINPTMTQHVTLSTQSLEESSQLSTSSASFLGSQTQLPTSGTFTPSHSSKSAGSFGELSSSMSTSILMSSSLNEFIQPTKVSTVRLPSSAETPQELPSTSLVTNQLPGTGYLTLLPSESVVVSNLPSTRISTSSVSSSSASPVSSMSVSNSGGTVSMTTMSSSTTDTTDAFTPPTSHAQSSVPSTSPGTESQGSELPVSTPGITAYVTSRETNSTTEGSTRTVSTPAGHQFEQTTSATNVTMTTPHTLAGNQTLTLTSIKFTTHHVTNATMDMQKKEHTTMNFTSPLLTAVTTKKAATSKVTEKPENSSTTDNRPSVPGEHTTPHAPTITHVTQSTPVTTSPTVFIEITLLMSWPQFCPFKQSFIQDLKHIIHMQKQLLLLDDQFVIIEECFSAPSALQQGESFSEIKVTLYMVDRAGKINITLTIDASSVIKKGFQTSASIFKDKIVTVRFIDMRLSVRPTLGSGDVVKEKRQEPNSGVTFVIVLAAVGGLCCVALVILQVLLHRRVKAKKQRLFVSRGHRASIQSMDHVALGVIPKSRPNSGYWNPALEELPESEEYSHTMTFSSLANFCMDTNALHAEFQTIPFDNPSPSCVPVGEEDKNRFANVLPFQHSRVKLQRTAASSSDYINANYVNTLQNHTIDTCHDATPSDIILTLGQPVLGYMGEKRVYIATQSPLVNTVEDFWRMVWEQQSRVILMLNPLTQNNKPKQSTCYWPDNEQTDSRREFGDYMVTLKQRDIQHDYIDCTLEIMDLEKNLKREVHHFLLTCWPDNSVPEPLSFVKFVLDTRPLYENSGKPVIVHCGPGNGRTGTLIAVDMCMRMYEDRRRVDILSCIHKMRGERAGAVQTKEQYALIYQALNEYAVILGSPSISTRSSVITLHAML